MRAGHAVLSKIKNHRDTLYDDLEEYGAAMEAGLSNILDQRGLDYYQTRVGAMGCLFFTDEKVVDQTTAKTTDQEMYANYFHGLLEEGVYFAPSQFEAYFFGSQHGAKELDTTLEAQHDVLKRIH